MQRDRRLWTATVAWGFAAGVLLIGLGSESGWAAEREKASKKAKTKVTEPAAKARSAEVAAQSKACFGVTPTISKVSPDEGKPGDKVTITGANFGAPGCLRGVSFGPGNPAKFVHVSETIVTATVPQGKRGLEILSVTTASGEVSKPFLMK
jgi:hypothetical protein